MATGALDANGIWQYGEDDSEPTFSGMLNKLASSTSSTVTRLENFTGYTGTLPVANGGTGATTAAAAQTALGVGLVQVIPSTVVAVGGGTATVSGGEINIGGGGTGVELRGVFSSSYRNYRILVNSRSSVLTSIGMRLLQGGTPEAGATVYRHASIMSPTSATTIAYDLSNGTNSWTLGYSGGVSNVAFSSHSADIYMPNVATVTNFSNIGQAYSAGVPGVSVVAGWLNTTKAYDGISIGLSAGTIDSMSVQVLAYND